MSIASVVVNRNQSNYKFCFKIEVCVEDVNIKVNFEELFKLIMQVTELNPLLISNPLYIQLHNTI